MSSCLSQRGCLAGLHDGDRLVPTADTEFARDAVFGYHSSHLPSYIEEKANGEIQARDVVTLSLEELRGSQNHLFEKLMPLQHKTFVFGRLREVLKRPFAGPRQQEWSA